jgi:hypothetical protein
MNPYIYELVKGAIIGFCLMLLVLALFGCASPSRVADSEFAQLAYFKGCAKESVSEVDKVICKYFIERR